MHSSPAYSRTFAFGKSTIMSSSPMRKRTLPPTPMRIVRARRSSGSHHSLIAASISSGGRISARRAISAVTSSWRESRWDAR